MPTPLPEVCSPQVQRIADEDPNNLSAYIVCLKYEKELAAFKDKLRSVRILGFLLLHAPNRAVRSEVTKCIHSRRDSSDLADVVKKCKGRTPKSSEHSRPSFEAVNEEMKVNITHAPRNHQDAKVHALIRDNWRCVVTGILDREAPEIIGDLDWSNTVAVNTHCAHIIPEATFFGVNLESEENPKLDCSTSMAVLKRFRHDIDEFNGEKVHSLTNVMSVQFDVREAFDQLELYFEAISGEKNCYEVRWFGPGLPSIRQFVTFSTSDPENLPVPAPELLAMHATCCKVARLSGATEYIDKVYRDADEMDVLSADGASGDVLSYKLLSLPK